MVMNLLCVMAVDNNPSPESFSEFVRGVCVSMYACEEGRSPWTAATKKKSLCSLWEDILTNYYI